MIPEHVDAFIKTTVRSIWGLEALLLLRGAPEQNWSPEGLSATLRGAVPLVQGILDGFARAHIVRRLDDNTYIYAPPAETAALIDALAKVNSEFPMAVAKAILLAPNDKVQTFVDAFKFK